MLCGDVRRTSKGAEAWQRLGGRVKAGRGGLGADEVRRAVRDCARGEEGHGCLGGERAVRGGQEADGSAFKNGCVGMESGGREKVAKAGRGLGIRDD